MEVMIIKLEKVLNAQGIIYILLLQKCRSRVQKLDVVANYHILTVLISENFRIFL